ncbi:MAG: hypothetical protein CVT92_04900 [Bacteroidetes bacterium HGW-Bacteroidetes-1]|jgi:hypothetical protein|nr:MAG: hypothetical protein CVT92_04900 [Bacteroidetes bacterium HGW-Bacteroidetes-1]
MENKILERFGGLIKEEPLSCIENELLIKETCVLESVSPFSSYYNEIYQAKPLYLYLTLDTRPYFEKIMRIINKVKNEVTFHFDIVSAEITLPGNSPYAALRNCQ